MPLQHRQTCENIQKKESALGHLFHSEDYFSFLLSVLAPCRWDISCCHQVNTNHTGETTESTLKTGRKPENKKTGLTKGGDFKRNKWETYRQWSGDGLVCRCDRMFNRRCRGHSSWVTPVVPGDNTWNSLKAKQHSWRWLLRCCSASMADADTAVGNISTYRDIGQSQRCMQPHSHHRASILPLFWLCCWSGFTAWLLFLFPLSCWFVLMLAGLIESVKTDSTFTQ